MKHWLQVMTLTRRTVAHSSLTLVLLFPGWGAAAANRCEPLFRGTSHLDFHQRKDLIVTKMKPSLVKSRVLGSVQRLVDTLNVVHDSIVELAVPRSVTRTILYPMSGFDLTTPLRLFPEAENYVLVDNHSAMRADHVDGFVRRTLETDYRDRNDNWVKYDEIGGDTFVRLMTSLVATLPEAKINSIEFITDSSERVSVKIALTDARLNRTKTIFYLSGEIGKVDGDARDAAYRSGFRYLAVKSTQPGNWWDDLLDELAPRTILLKGSMSGLRQTAHDVHLLGRERILRPIFEDGGLIVEGASQMSPETDAKWARRLVRDRDRWELTDGDPRLQVPARERVLRGIEFSYSRNVRIGVYDPPN